MRPETFYHIYNSGNNRQPIFFNRENYLFFLRKARKHILPHMEMVAFCLMPNHFHFMTYAKPDIIREKFSRDLQIMLRSYTRAINKQENRTGSLFQQNTKIKLLEMDSDFTIRNGRIPDDYPFICFHYIHQNPLKAGLVSRMEEWEMSSFKDYADIRSDSICNKNIAYNFLDVPESHEHFLEQSYKVQILDNNISGVL